MPGIPPTDASRDVGLASGVRPSGCGVLAGEGLDCQTADADQPPMRPAMCVWAREQLCRDRNVPSTPQPNPCSNSRRICGGYAGMISEANQKAIETAGLS